MIYETSLTIPKNTPITAPVSAVVSVHPGIVRQFGVEFPSGCCGLARVQVWYWGHQVWPSNPDSYFHGDDINLVFPEDIRLVDLPYEFVVVGWNLDDTFQHTVTVRIAITPEDSTIVQVLERMLVGPSGPVTEVGA